MQLGLNHVDVATSYHEPGRLYCLMGKLEQGKDYCKEALEIQRMQSGQNHIDVATS